MKITKPGRGTAILMVSAAWMLAGCEDDPSRVDGPTTATPVLAMAVAPPHTEASGTFTQTAVTSLEVRLAGPTTILEQTAQGSISGTLSGSFEDDLKVVIHPNGRFNAQFTITCVCTVEGRQGVLEIVANDTGELVTPDLAAFAGRAVIRAGTGQLAGLRGVLQIEGTVHVPSGLATYGYTGHIHFQP